MPEVRASEERARLRLPLPADETPFASVVQGMGLLAATVMALTGAIIFFQTGAYGSTIGIGSGALGVHRALANPMSAYLIGHASLAVLDQLYGHRDLQRMFST
ncbi:MAG: cytochrome b/b6 domain-containing protein [Rhodomicrobiaceae bacterium]